MRYSSRTRTATAGKRPQSTIITVTVSSGGENVKDTYKVIDFTGKTLDYVQAALASHDIKCEVVEEYSDDVEEGKVIRTDPEAGAELEKGATLTVYISKGKQKDDNENVSVPGLLGMTRTARAALEARVASRLGEPVDSLLRPVRSYGSRRMPVRGAKGSRQHPDLKGKSTSNNNSPDNNSGGNSGGQDNGDGDYDDTPSLGSATIPVSLPDNTDTAHVIIYVDGVIQYDDTCSTSGGSTSISVSGSVGDHDVTVSVDGSTTSQTYTFS
ncbi:MAG: PASTA domain-containing protein [Butyricicoccus sp.]